MTAEAVATLLECGLGVAASGTFGLLAREVAEVVLAVVSCDFAVHELVDWRFLFLLNRVSPGPRIHIHVRELKLQFPMYPVVPDMTNARRCSTAGGAPTGDGQECGSGEQEKQRQLRHAQKRWLKPQEFVSTFIRRALNISQPMRLRHLRRGNRPGLCVAEILREQHYLLEWQVPLRCLQEPSARSSCSVAEAKGDSSLVWPLPPYGSLELDSLAQLGGGWRHQDRMEVHNVVDENRPRRSRQVPEVDAVHDDRLIFDVLDRGSVFASLLSPLSVGTTAAAIFVGAVLVAVATSSATAAITTAAAATATLAARSSRLFRVDLHVLERDEHEDDQEEVTECDIPPSCLVSSFSGSRGLAPGPLASGYGIHGEIGNEATPYGAGPPSSCGPACAGEESLSGSLRPRLPHLGRLLEDRLVRLFRSSRLASAALSEASRALASTILSSISRDAATAASTVLAAAGAVLTAVLRPPGTGQCRPAGNVQPLGGPTDMRISQKQRLPQGGVQVASPTGSQPDAEVEGKRVGKSVDSSSNTKSMKQFKHFLTQNRGNPEQLHGKEGLRQLRRRGALGDSAFLRSPPAAPFKPRRSQSFLSVCIGAFHRRSCCSMPARCSRSFNPCDIFGQPGGGQSIAHRVRALSTGAAILQHPQSHVRRPLWRGSSSTSESNSVGTEREDTSSSDQDREMNGSGATWTPTLEFSGQSFGCFSSGWRLEGPPLQPGHGLLLFVRTCLPPATLLCRARGSMKCYRLGTSEWDAAAASPFRGLPEDVPLLLPMDATVTDLVRLLFLTLTERKYVLPLISDTQVGDPQVSSSHLDGIMDRPYYRRRKDRNGQTTHSSGAGVLRFWLASTHPNREHDEQPLPSAKLAADLRLTSCERLTLTVMPFALARRGASACAGCLTLTCGPRGPPAQTPGHRGNSKGVQSGTILPPCNPHLHPTEDERSPDEASPWLLSPLSAWTQENTLTVETGMPTEGEPTIVLRREAALEPVYMTAESNNLCSQMESCPQAESFFEELRPHRCATNTEQREVNVDGKAASVFLAPDTPMYAEPTSALKPTERTSLRDAEEDERANTLYSNADSSASVDTSSRRFAGITLEEEDANLCTPWILQSSVNARQFEYHPAKGNVLLTGNNDGRVSTRVPHSLLRVRTHRQTRDANFCISQSVSCHQKIMRI